MCDMCREEEVSNEIDGWDADGGSLWTYDLCKKCYKKIKKFIEGSHKK